MFYLAHRSTPPPPQAKNKELGTNYSVENVTTKYLPFLYCGVDIYSFNFPMVQKTF